MLRKMKNAIGYISVSTEEQAEEGRYGIESQKSAILVYADKNGYNIVEWKIDKMSGASDERPELNSILYGEVQNPPVQAVIVFKNDRIARDTKLYFYYLYWLEKKNIKLLSTKEEFAEGSDFANIYRALLMFVAEQERKNIALRTGRGRSQKAACGGYSGGRVPYGYRVEAGVLKVREDERKIVEFVFAEKAAGTPMKVTAEKMNDMGWRTRKGTWFQTSSVRSILENEPFYRGLYKYGKDAAWVKGVHEPILKGEE